MLKIRKGRDRDVYELVGKLREADRNELYASDGQDPDLTLIKSWQNSKRRWSAFHNDTLAFVFGVTVSKDMSEGIGIPWLLGSDEVLKVRKSFIKESNKYLDLMLSEFDILVNLVDTRNTLSIRWLKWLGFEFKDPQAFGYENRPFVVFTKMRN